jgi:hypothetical protein
VDELKMNEQILEQSYKLMNRIRQEQGLSDSQIEQWLNVIANGHLSLEVAEQIDQAVTELEYGHIVIAISHHEITTTSAAPSTKTVARSRQGNRTLQLPKQQPQRRKKLDTN